MGGICHREAAPEDEGEPVRAPPAALGAYVQAIEFCPQTRVSAKPTEPYGQESGAKPDCR